MAQSTSINELIAEVKVLLMKDLHDTDSISDKTELLERLSIENSDERGLRYTAYFRGLVLSRLELADSSINVLNRLIETIPQVERDSSLLYTSVMMILSKSYYQKGDYKNSLSHYMEVKSEAKRIGREETVRSVDFNIGMLYMRMGDLDLAYDYFSLARKHYDQLLPSDQARLLAAFGTYYSQRIQLDSAAHYYRLGMERHKDNGDLRGVAHGFNNLAIVAYQQGKVEEAITGFETALGVRLQLGNKRNIADGYFNLGFLYASQGRNQMAIRNYQKGLEVIQGIGSLITERDLLFELSEVYGRLGQADSAYRYLSDWRVLNDSLLTINKQEEMLALEKQYQTEQLKNQAQLAAKENELKTSQRNLLFVAMLALAVVAVVVVYVLRLRFQRNMAITEREKLKAENKSDLALNKLALKDEELANYANQLLLKNETLELLKARLDEHRSIDDKISTLDTGRKLEEPTPDINNDKGWLTFKLQFENAYPDFFSKLLHEGKDLSAHDQRLATLIKVNLSNKEIGQVLNISTDSVAKAKYRLRQKLGFDHYAELESFIFGA